MRADKAQAVLDEVAIPAFTLLECFFRLVHASVISSSWRGTFCHPAYSVRRALLNAKRRSWSWVPIGCQWSSIRLAGARSVSAQRHACWAGTPAGRRAATAASSPRRGTCPRGAKVSPLAGHQRADQTQAIDAALGQLVLARTAGDRRPLVEES